MKRANDAYVRQLAKASRRTFTETLNEEIRFARCWFLPAQLAARLSAEAERRGLLAKDLVALYVHAELSTWPPARTPAVEPPLKYAPKSSMAITGPNDAFLREIGERLTMPHTEVIDLLLDFNRRFSLPAHLLGALAERAESLGIEARDLVIEILMRRTVQLPPATAETSSASC